MESVHVQGHVRCICKLKLCERCTKNLKCPIINSNEMKYLYDELLRQEMQSQVIIIGFTVSRICYFLHVVNILDVEENFSHAI